MNFYHAYYKRQVYDGEIGEWRDTFFRNQGIVVIANDYNEAVAKIHKCLEKAEDDTNASKYITSKYRAKLLSITKCIGLNVREAYEGGSDIYPIRED